MTKWLKIRGFIEENKFLMFSIIVICTYLFLAIPDSRDSIFLVIFISIFFSIIMDKIEHMLRLISISKLADQLESKNLELRRSENRFKSIFTQTKIPMCIFNLNTKKFIAVNRYLCDLLEYSEKELIEASIESLILNEDLKDSIDVVDMNLKDQKLDEYINRYITKSGKIIKIKWTFTKGDEEGISYCVAQQINY